MTEEEKIEDNLGEIWYTYMTTGDIPEDILKTPWYLSKRLRPLFLRLPAEPRCRICFYPFKGLGGSIMRRIFGIAPSKLNPSVCNMCDSFFEKFGGGTEVELTILFADVRGSTSLAEQMNPMDYSRLISRFYNATTKVLYHKGALVEKLAGDAVTAIFTPGFASSQHARVAIQAGRDILRATGHHQPDGPWIQVGIGVHTGKAYVGTVSSDAGARDIAVLGDTANTGARLSSLAGPGEILASQEAASQAGLEPQGIEIRRLALKGRSEPVEAWVL